jgi:methylglutamate dehydrogenase subunit C
MAALVAARAGADVILADEDMRMGGRLLADRAEVDGQPGADWAASVLAELAAMPNVRLMPRTTVTGAYDHGTYGALERVACTCQPRRCRASASGGSWRSAPSLPRARWNAPSPIPQQRPARRHDGRGAVAPMSTAGASAPGKRVTLCSATTTPPIATARDLMAAGVMWRP